MPRISLWKPNQKEDYTYIDRVSREHFDLGATGVYVHKYVGPELDEDDERAGSGVDELTIGDVLFLENRNRQYDTDIYELRGAYNPADTDLDLSQFGIFLSDDTLRMTFHLNDMVDRLGRKLMSGDVLELPHLREYFGLDESKSATNRFYVVEDASYPAEGFSPRWWNHMWRVKAKMMTDSPEFENILNRVVNEDGTTSSGPGDDCCDETLRDILSQAGRDEEVTDAIIAEAERDVKYDPLWFENRHFYVTIDQEGLAGLVEWKGGTDEPPNGLPLRGQGDRFPESMLIGDIYLRTDFQPPVLYQKETNCKFKRIKLDERKLPWTGANRVYDRYLENDREFTADDGTVMPSRQAPSKTLKARTKRSVNQIMESPRGIRAEPVDTGVLVTWEQNGVGQGFRIWRADTQAGLFTDPQVVGTAGMDSREFTDTDVEPATLYFYRVSVFDDTQERFTSPAQVVTALNVVVTPDNQYVQDSIDNFVTNPDDTSEDPE